jgi:hypothetical protein
MGKEFVSVHYIVPTNLMSLQRILLRKKKEASVRERGRSSPHCSQLECWKPRTFPT